MSANAKIVIDRRKGELILTGTNEQVANAMHALSDSEHHYREVSIAFEGADGEDAWLTMPGNREEIKNALTDIYEADIIECEHEFTETVGVDDDRWIGEDGELHERSNPDCEHCLICGKYYYPEAEEWRDE